MSKPVKGMRAFNSADRRKIRETLIERYGAYCQICLANGLPKSHAAIDMETRREAKSFSIDHILALADGGSNTIDNMHPTHQRCNERKGSMQDNAYIKPARRRQNVTSVTGARLAYTSSSY